MTNEIIIVDLNEKDRLIINNEEYEVVRVEDNLHISEEGELVDKGFVATLYKIGDKPIASLPLFNYLSEENGKLRLLRSKLKENQTFPKNMPETFKYKETEAIKIPIKEIKIK